jgi:hypothetical protein
LPPGVTLGWPGRCQLMYVVVSRYWLPSIPGANAGDSGTSALTGSATTQNTALCKTACWLLLAGQRTEVAVYPWVHWNVKIWRKYWEECYVLHPEQLPAPGGRGGCRRDISGKSPGAGLHALTGRLSWVGNQKILVNSAHLFCLDMSLLDIWIHSRMLWSVHTRNLELLSLLLHWQDGKKPPFDNVLVSPCWRWTERNGAWMDTWTE